MQGKLRSALLRERTRQLRYDRLPVGVHLVRMGRFHVCLLPNNFVSARIPTELQQWSPAVVPATENRGGSLTAPPGIAELVLSPLNIPFRLTVDYSQKY